MFSALTTIYSRDGISFVELAALKLHFKISAATYLSRLAAILFRLIRRKLWAAFTVVTRVISKWTLLRDLSRGQRWQKYYLTPACECAPEWTVMCASVTEPQDWLTPLSCLLSSLNDKAPSSRWGQHPGRRWQPQQPRAQISLELKEIQARTQGVGDQWSVLFYRPIRLVGILSLRLH